MENEIRLLPGEIDYIMKVAAAIFAKYGPKEGERFSAKEMFIRGFLHGRQYTLDDIGILDGEHENDGRIYKFLQDHGL